MEINADFNPLNVNTYDLKADKKLLADIMLSGDAAKIRQRSNLHSAALALLSGKASSVHFLLLDDMVATSIGRGRYNHIIGKKNGKVVLDSAKNPSTKYHPNGQVDYGRGMLFGEVGKFMPTQAIQVKASLNSITAKGGTFNSPTFTRWGGFNVHIERPAGSVRSGVDMMGNKWETVMLADYGEIASSIGDDGDRVDVYLGLNPQSNNVYVVHQAQKDNWTELDEHKVMLGFDSLLEAEKMYLAHYQNDPRFILKIDEMSVAEFRSRLKQSNTSGSLF